MSEKVIAILVINNTIKIGDVYHPEDFQTYLNVAKEMTKNGVNPLEKEWIFEDKSFKNFIELSKTNLDGLFEEGLKLKNDVQSLEIIEEINFEKGYIKLHKDVPDDVLIDTFRAIPTFWHLNIIKGDKTWQNIGDYATEYFALRSVQELKDLTKKYFNEGDEK